MQATPPNRVRFAPDTVVSRKRATSDDSDLGRTARIAALVNQGKMRFASALEQSLTSTSTGEKRRKSKTRRRRQLSSKRHSAPAETSRRNLNKLARGKTASAEELNWRYLPLIYQGLLAKKGRLMGMWLKRCFMLAEIRDRNKKVVEVLLCSAKPVRRRQVDMSVLGGDGVDDDGGDFRLSRDGRAVTKKRRQSAPSEVQKKTRRASRGGTAPGTGHDSSLGWVMSDLKVKAHMSSVERVRMPGRKLLVLCVRTTLGELTEVRLRATTPYRRNRWGQVLHKIVDRKLPTPPADTVPAVRLDASGVHLESWIPAAAEEEDPDAWLRHHEFFEDDTDTMWWVAQGPRRRIGKFRVFELLGAGAYAQVYRGVDVETGDVVALKCVKLGGRNNDTVLQKNFEAHINALRRLQGHRNIIALKYHEWDAAFPMRSGLERRICLTALGFCEGGDVFQTLLFDLQTPHTRVGENIIRHYFGQLLDAVAHCHAFGVIHRDIKLQNLLLTRRFVLKLADFNLASVDTGDGVRGMRGTKMYMAPEVIKIGKTGEPYAGRPSDLWSCAVCLFTLAFKAPFLDGLGPEPIVDGTIFNSEYMLLEKHKFEDFFKKHITESERSHEGWVVNVVPMLTKMFNQDPAKRGTVESFRRAKWLRAQPKLMTQRKVTSEIRRLLAIARDDRASIHAGGGGAQKCVNKELQRAWSERSLENLRAHNNTTIGGGDVEDLGHRAHEQARQYRELDAQERLRLGIPDRNSFSVGGGLSMRSGGGGSSSDAQNSLGAVLPRRIGTRSYVSSKSQGKSVKFASVADNVDDENGVADAASGSVGANGATRDDLAGSSTSTALEANASFPARRGTAQERESIQVTRMAMAAMAAEHEVSSSARLLSPLAGLRKQPGPMRRIGSRADQKNLRRVSSKLTMGAYKSVSVRNVAPLLAENRSTAGAPVLAPTLPQGWRLPRTTVLYSEADAADILAALVEALESLNLPEFPETALKCLCQAQSCKIVARSATWQKHPKTRFTAAARAIAHTHKQGGARSRSMRSFRTALSMMKRPPQLFLQVFRLPSSRTGQKRKRTSRLASWRALANAGLARRKGERGGGSPDRLGADALYGGDILHVVDIRRMGGDVSGFLELFDALKIRLGNIAPGLFDGGSSAHRERRWTLLRRRLRHLHAVSASHSYDSLASENIGPYGQSSSRSPPLLTTAEGRERSGVCDDDDNDAVFVEKNEEEEEEEDADGVEGSGAKKQVHFGTVAPAGQEEEEEEEEMLKIMIGGELVMVPPRRGRHRTPSIGRGVKASLIKAKSKSRQQQSLDPSILSFGTDKRKVSLSFGAEKTTRMMRLRSEPLHQREKRSNSTGNVATSWMTETAKQRLRKRRQAAEDASEGTGGMLEPVAATVVSKAARAKRSITQPMKRSRTRSQPSAERSPVSRSTYQGGRPDTVVGRNRKLMTNPSDNQLVELEMEPIDEDDEIYRRAPVLVPTTSSAAGYPRKAKAVRVRASRRASLDALARLNAIQKAIDYSDEFDGYISSSSSSASPPPSSSENAVADRRRGRGLGLGRKKRRATSPDGRKRLGPQPLALARSRTARGDLHSTVESDRMLQLQQTPNPRMKQWGRTRSRNRFKSAESRSYRSL